MSASVPTNTWVSWQPLKEESQSSDIPVARTRSSSRPPLISGNKGGRVSRRSKIARGEGGVEGCEGSDVTSHICSWCLKSAQTLRCSKNPPDMKEAQREKENREWGCWRRDPLHLCVWKRDCGEPCRRLWMRSCVTSSAVRYEVTAWQTVALVVASTSWPNKPQCFPWLTFPLRCHTWWEELAPVVSLGEDYITNLVKNWRCYSTFIFSVINARTPVHIWVLARSHVRVFFLIIPDLQVPCRNLLGWCANALGLLWVFFHDKILSVMQRGPSEARDDKMDNKRGPAGPPSSGGHRLGLLHFLWKTGTGPRGSSCQLRSLTSLASRALPPTPLPLCRCSLLLLFSLLRRLNAGFYPRPATVLHPDTAGQASSGFCCASAVLFVVWYEDCNFRRMWIK